MGIAKSPLTARERKALRLMRKFQEEMKKNKKGTWVTLDPWLYRYLFETEVFTDAFKEELRKLGAQSLSEETSRMIIR